MGEESLFNGPKLRRSLSSGRAGSCIPVPTWSQRKDQGKHRSRSSASNAVSARKLGADLWEIQDFGPTAPVRKDPRPRGEEARGFQFDGFSDRVTACDQVRAHNPPITSKNSFDLDGRNWESDYNLKTSRELMRIVNQIWNLEEQQESNLSLIKELRSELDHARVRIQELIQEQLADRQVIDELVSKITENKLICKIKEHKMIKEAVKSAADELEAERRSRRHLDSLHEKLAVQLSDVKSSYTKLMGDLEMERKTRILLEDFCDELAGGIRCYEHELQELGLKSGRNSGPGLHHFVFNISKAWLEERSQIKHAEDSNELNDILRRLTSEVDSFRTLKKAVGFGVGILDKKETRENDRVHDRSCESLHLNGANADRSAEDEYSSSDMHCFELNMPDDGVVHCNFDLDGDKREMPHKEARRSVSVRDKIGYFENIVNRLFKAEKPSDEKGGVNFDNGHTMLSKNDTEFLGNRDSSLASSEAHEVEEREYYNKAKPNGLPSINLENGNSNCPDFKVHSRIKHTGDLSGVATDASYRSNRWNIRDALMNIAAVNSPLKSTRSRKGNSSKSKLPDAEIAAFLHKRS